jgi:hypothetical protein
MSTNRKGAIAEAMIAAEAIESGFSVYRPVTEGSLRLIDESAGQGFVHLRLRPARNGQHAGLRWADEYPLGAIAQLGERVTGSHEVAGSSPASSTSNVRPLR